MDVASAPHLPVMAPGPVCEKLIADPALSSLAANVGRKAVLNMCWNCRFQENTRPSCSLTLCPTLSWECPAEFTETLLHLKDRCPSYMPVAGVAEGDRAVSLTWVLPTHVMDKQ